MNETIGIETGEVEKGFARRLPMCRNLSPILRRELANLDKDADSRKSAMKALKSYVKDLDSKAIPLFLAQVSETKETGSLSGEYTISLYEVLARVHGVKIVPQIDSIMATIIKTLASSAGSFPLQQACSKVVPAIARYGIDPTTPEDKKRLIIHSLCKPLSDSLLGSQESLTSGSALCLKALVDSDNWRFASDEMVNNVCQNVAGALEEKSTQTNSHMGLVMTLAKHNALIVEAYARLLIQSGLRILYAGVLEKNSQKRLSAIQMVNFLMKCLDSRSIFSELELIIEEMEKCQSDQMAYVSGAAFEALQTARRLVAEKELKYEKCCGSNFGRRDRKRNISNSGDRSPSSTSPESQTLDSFVEYDSFTESPISMSHVTSDMDCRSVNRKLWILENGGVDVSLKDGLFSEVAQGSSTSSPCYMRSGQHELNCNGVCSKEEFSGFLLKSPGNISRSTTPSPQRPHSHINLDNIIFRTPRRLIHSLQETNDVNYDVSDKQTRRCRTPSPSKVEWTQSPRYDQNGFYHDENYEVNGNGNSYVGDQFQGGYESVSSTDDIPREANDQKSDDMVEKDITKIQNFGIEKTHRKFASRMLFALIFVLLAAFTLLMIDGQNEVNYMVPT